MPGPSSYSQFRKKRPNPREAHIDLGAQLQEIDLLARELDTLTRSRKSISAAGNRSIPNDYSSSDHELREEMEELTTSARNYTCKTNKVAQEVRRPGHQRANSVSAKQLHEEDAHSYSQSPKTDRGPPSPVTVPPAKQAPINHSSLLSTSNSGSGLEFNPELQEILRDQLQQLADRVGSRELPVECLFEMLGKIQELEGVLDRMEEF